ncbi:MAG: hypothetical protein ACD_82C00043G0001 [uncultured bacterium]|nr:MAG: hypothetical protein ACD_82C00043G0001 [uncultured bacterium]
MPTLHSSSLAFRIFTSSSLLVELISGSLNLINFPSFSAFNPRSDSFIPFSMSPIIELSHGWIVRSFASGAASTAIVLRGIGD